MATHFQYSCLENPIDTGAWQTMVHRVTKSWTRPKQLSTKYLIRHFKVIFLYLSLGVLKAKGLTFIQKTAPSLD